MSVNKTPNPELKRYMDKKIRLKLNANREIEGILRGFDPFMNLCLDETIEITKDGQRRAIGMISVRGNSIVMLEAMDQIDHRTNPVQH
jgi:small nuclear ribonucleoprotein G